MFCFTGRRLTFDLPKIVRTNEIKIRSKWATDISVLVLISKVK